MSWFKRESLSINHSYQQQNLHDGKISFCCKKHTTQPLQRMVAKKNLILVTMCSRVSQLTSDNHKTQFAIRLWSSVTDRRWKHHQTERWGIKNPLHFHAVPWNIKDNKCHATLYWTSAVPHFPRGRTPFYMSHVCAAPKGIRFLSHLGLKTGMDFAHSSLKLGNVFKGATS